MEPDREFMGVMRWLIFKGHLLAYDPTYNVVEWVLICGTVSTCDPPKSNHLQVEQPYSTQGDGQHPQNGMRHAPATTPVDRRPTSEAEMQRVSFAADGSTDICLVEFHDGCDHVSQHH